MYTISSNGILNIKQEEGERLKAYKDVKGLWTIGVGHLVLPNEMYMTAPGFALTPDQSTELLRSDLSKVIQAINSRITVSLTQNQVDALGSLFFNIGVNGADGLVALINRKASPDEIYQRWTNYYITPSVLKPRRIREANIYLGSTSSPVMDTGNAVKVGLVLIGLAYLLSESNKKSN